MPTRGTVIPQAWQHGCGGFVSGRRRSSLHETTAQFVNAHGVWANVGRIFGIFGRIFRRRRYGRIFR